MILITCSVCGRPAYDEWTILYPKPAQERFYFGDTVLPLFESGIPLLRERLAKLEDKDNVTIAYPDEGAWKRFKYQFDEYPEAGSRRPSLCHCRHYC